MTKSFQSARHPAELRAAAESAARNMERKFRAQVERDHEAAKREDSARRAAADLGVDFDAFMAEDA